MDNYIPNSSDNDKSAIAIIGMAGRFPGAKTIDEFWQNLRDGVAGLSRFSDEELLSEGVDPPMLSNPNYVKVGYVLSDIEGFDASFFGFSAREAEIMDPQQRLFFECAWEAIESAGYNPETNDYLIGVYSGIAPSTYLLSNLLNTINPNYDVSGRNLLSSALGVQVMSGNGIDFLATRIAYKLNLKGPAVNVQTACSTSLVAVHMAIMSLLNGECDMALAGGVSVWVPHNVGYLYQEGMIVSPDGYCRAFDAKAKGTVFGDGVGVVLLKRLEDAIADGDCIHAVIKGSAVNNDGKLKVGYTAPSIEGQATVIFEAQQVAGIDPETITYIEAHGTGTAVGDPIEIAALSKVFRASTQKKGFCAIGSVKTNVGHLVVAAGAAGLIKTVLALKHKLLPPSLHFEQPNPQIDFANSPFYVNSQLSEWKTNGTPRRAGVSSFGIGGTNAHVIVEEWDFESCVAPGFDLEPERTYQLLLLSARSSSALEMATANLTNHLKQHPDINLADVAYTLAVGRKSFNYRRVVVCGDIDEAVSALSTLDAKRVFTNSEQVKKRSVVFMFSGQGSQYVNMARELYEVEPTFQETVDRCCELLQTHLGFDLRDVLYPSTQKAQADKSLQETALTQPALFVIEYALAKLWMEWGIRPAAAIGHSIGEYVAATIAGVFSLEDALSLVAVRGKLMQSMPQGSMLAVPLPATDVQPLLDGQPQHGRPQGSPLQVALINTPSNCVVSGTTEAIAALQQQLAAQGVECRLLHTSHAFHSQMMEPILAPFTELVKKVNLQPPKLPYISNVTGTWITAKEATDPTYWAKHLRQTVRFAEGVQQFLTKPDQILLEVGPGRTLSTLAKRHPDRRPEQLILTSLRHPQDNQSDVSFLLSTLGQLWLAGVEVDWWRFYAHEQRYRLPLPTYPFERQRYWIEPPKQAHTNGKVQQIEQFSAASSPSSQLNGLAGKNGKDAVKSPQVSLDKKPDIADWFYTPSWKRSPISVDKPNQIAVDSCILVFIDESGLGSQLLKRLELEGHTVVSVRVGSEFTKLEPRHYALNTQQRDDYDALLQELIAENLIPKTILHLWSLAPNERQESELDWVETSQNLGFYSLLFLAQAIGKQQINDDLHIAVVTNNMQNIATDAVLHPEQATVLGPCQIIPLEYPNITCSCIDIVLSEPETAQSEQVIDQILLEIATKTSDVIVAYRQSERWLPTFEPAPLNPAQPCTGSAPVPAPRLREQGVYLITGGLGGIGLTLADYLAQTVQAKLILTTRSAFPPADEWEQWLATHDEQDATSSKIRKLQAMQSLGAEVAIACADVANLQQMQAAITQSVERWGQINGIIHAAGVPGRGVIQRKTREMAERVLASKVKGTLVLDTLLKDVQLDFFVNCSSLASIIPLFGQVDYCAANAFLNAFAHYKTAKDGTFAVSINWDSWQKVGMAVEAAKQRAGELTTQGSEEKKLSNSLFDKCLVEGEQEIYVTNLSALKHWVLDEHRVLGKPTLPGTAYLEMARAAFEAHTKSSSMEMQDVYFLNPLVVEENEEKHVRTILKKQENGFEFAIVSQSSSGEEWQQHAIGKITSITEELPEKYEVKKWKQRCKEKVANPKLQEEIIEFGSRWDSLKQLKFGKNQGVALLELPEAFVGDLDTYKLHPALIDVATSFIGLKHPGAYLPFSYKKLKIKGSLPAKFYSYIKSSEKKDQSDSKSLKFNIAIADEKGTALVEVEGLLLRELDEPELVDKKSDKSASQNENFCLEIAAPGLLDTLTFRSAPRQKPGSGEVEIEVAAVGLNFKEVIIALGMLPPQPNTPLTFGLECSGKIVALGEGVEGFQVGDEVIAFGSSCFSQFTTTSVQLVALKPAHLNWQEATTIPVAFMTAYYALVTLGRLSQGEKVLIHAAAGGVGLAAVKIAQMLGAEIFATAGKPEKRDFLHSLGIDHVMDSRSLAFADEVMQRTGGKGVDVVLNSLSGEFIPKSLSTLARYGRFLEIGKRDIYENTQLGLRPFEKNLSFFTITLEPEIPNFNSLLQDVVQHFHQGNLTPLPQQVFPLTEVADAFDYMARAKHIGKIVVSLENKQAVKSLGSQGRIALGTNGSSGSRSQAVDSTEQEKPTPVINVILKDLNQGLLPTEGVEVFQRLLGSTLPCALISTRDLQSRIEQNSVSTLLTSLNQSKLDNLSQSAKPRPNLSQAYVPPRNQIERTIAEIWQQFFRVEQVGIEDDFFELGGDSLLAVQLISQVRKAAGTDVPLERLLDSPTVAGLAQAIDTLRQGKTSAAIVTEKVVNLRAEAVLEPAIRPETLPVEFVTNPDTILLTGATGYIGSYLLHELLEQTPASIYCLVRSANADEGKQRIQRSLESYGLWNQKHSARILPVIGDLAAERLGLDERQFHDLARQIDVIYHNGAWVNFLYPYSMLKPANVLGTQEVLRLACQNKVKPVHFISSYVVACEAYPQAQQVRESDPLIWSPNLDTTWGYGQSKWVAEKLVEFARDRGLPLCIYRPGEIIGDQKKGIPNSNQMTWAIIQSCIQMGIAPELDTTVDLTPVDYIAQATVHLSQQTASAQKVFHLVNPHPITWRELFNSISSLGYSIGLISPENWRKALIHHAENHPENALQPFLPLFSENMAFGQPLPRLDCANTLDGLVGTDIICPPPDRRSLGIYLSYNHEKSLYQAAQKKRTTDYK